MRILGISGSLRAGSHNTQLLRLAAEELPEGVELELYEDLAAIPPFDQDLVEVAPDEVEQLKEAVAASDAILVATPELNGSIPGQLKNALDWVSRPLAANPLRNKPAVVVGASTGAFGAVWAQAELRKVLASIGARVVDAEAAVGHAPTRFDEDGTLIDEDLREQLGEVVDALAAAITERAELARTAA